MLLRSHSFQKQRFRPWWPCWRQWIKLIAAISYSNKGRSFMWRRRELNGPFGYHGAANHLPFLPLLPPFTRTLPAKVAMSTRHISVNRDADGFADRRVASLSNMKWMSRLLWASPLWVSSVGGCSFSALSQSLLPRLGQGAHQIGNCFARALASSLVTPR